MRACHAPARWAQKALNPPRAFGISGGRHFPFRRAPARRARTPCGRALCRVQTATGNSATAAHAPRRATGRTGTFSQFTPSQRLRCGGLGQALKSCVGRVRTEFGVACQSFAHRVFRRRWRAGRKVLTRGGAGALLQVHNTLNTGRPRYALRPGFGGLEATFFSYGKGRFGTCKSGAAARGT